jgi:hypothetical protein
MCPGEEGGHRTPPAQITACAGGVVPILAPLSDLSPLAATISGAVAKLGESSEDSVSHSLMAAACGRCQAVSKTRLTITASGFGCP